MFNKPSTPMTPRCSEEELDLLIKSFSNNDWGILGSLVLSSVTSKYTLFTYNEAKRFLMCLQTKVDRIKDDLINDSKHDFKHVYHPSDAAKVNETNIRNVLNYLGHLCNHGILDVVNDCIMDLFIDVYPSGLVLLDIKTLRGIKVIENRFTVDLTKLIDNPGDTSLDNLHPRVKEFMLNIYKPIDDLHNRDLQMTLDVWRHIASDLKTHLMYFKRS